MCSGNETEDDCDELQTQSPKGVIHNHLERNTSQREREVTNRRATTYYIINPVPSNTVTGEAFKLLIGIRRRSTA